MLSACIKSHQAAIPENLLIKDPRVFLIEFMTKEQTIRSFKGIAVVKVEKDGKGFEYEEVIIFKKPASFRFETLSPLKTTLAIVTGKNISVNAYLSGSNTFYTAYLNRDAVEKLLFLPLEPFELFPVLYGGLIQFEFYTAEVEYDDSDNNYILTLNDGNLNILKIRINPQDRTIKSFEKINLFSKTTLIVNYADYKMINGYRFPMLIKVESPGNDLAVTLRYDTVEINTDIDETLFKIDPPKGALRKFLD